MRERTKLYSEIINQIYHQSMHLSNTVLDIESLRQLLKVDRVRAGVVGSRLQQALDNCKLNTLVISDSHHIWKDTGRGKNTVEHNLEGLRNDISSARSGRLIKVLSSLEHIRPLSLNQRPCGVMHDLDIEINVNVLCIGPRTEAEPLLMWAYGFNIDKIRSVDLISYSSLIDLGDMHKLPYDDKSFDVVFCACTLPYSNSPHKAANEMKRVAKTNGTFAIMLDIESKSYMNDVKKRYGFPMSTPEDIVHLFGSMTDYKILFKHFEENNLTLPNGTTSMVIFKSESCYGSK